VSTVTAVIEPFAVPFTILVDSAESQPFTFQGIDGDADIEGRPLAISTHWCCLGRYPHSLGDYSIDGFVGRVAVERKGVEDYWSTLLGWETPSQRERGMPGRRERFEKELENLSAIEAAMVVVEAPFDQCLREVPQWGVKTNRQNAKALLRTTLAYMQDYKVPFLFCDGRRLAEVTTFRFLQRFWRKHEKEYKELRKSQELANDF
jgi:hypothetical protein